MPGFPTLAVTTEKNTDNDSKANVMASGRIYPVGLGRLHRVKALVSIHDIL